MDNSLKTSAYSYIKENILNCKICGGDRIREDILADQLSVSRTPIREAINQLIMEGLVVSIPHIGVYCVDLRPDEIDELCVLRTLYETYAVEKCIENYTKRGIQELKRLVIPFEKAVKKNRDVPQFDNRFHEAIIKMSGNVRLISSFAAIRDRIHILRAKMSYENSKILGLQEKLQRKSVGEHAKIVEYIENRNRDEAVELIKSHIDQMRKLMSGET